MGFVLVPFLVFMVGALGALNTFVNVNNLLPAFALGLATNDVQNLLL